MITWINCLERMPPDDNEAVIIVRGDWLRIRCGSTINKLNNAIDYSNDKWTPYTEEAWSELASEEDKLGDRKTDNNSSISIDDIPTISPFRFL